MAALHAKLRAKKEQGLLSQYSSTLGELISRHRVEEALRAANLESRLASRAKSEFLANMSHELRTPLNAILGFSDLIRRPWPTGKSIDPMVSEYASHIHEAGQHLLAIINDILDVSKIESGSFKLDLDMHDIKEVIDASLLLIMPRLERKAQTLTVEINPALPAITMDARRLKQILVNLLSNAHKFSPQQSLITLKANALQKTELMISVTDNGIGMTDEEIAMALKPFGQVASAMSRSQEGSGLGLPISKALAELHGGTFRITSAPGKGTSVIFTIPVRQGEVKPFPSQPITQKA